MRRTLFHRGFTLIELLVVIAIIGILAAVVLASLNSARGKGSDAGIKSNLHSVQTQGAIYYSDNGSSFGTFGDGNGIPLQCPLPGAQGPSVVYDSTIENAIAAAVVDSGGGTAMCLANDTGFSVAVTRPINPAPPSTYWCVDSENHNCGVNSNLLVGASCGACDSTN
ncbi:type II secretion system GspH family protein [Patescibacteria group bacterium]|nr:type II secretion system GspH family protein [Patescibacteria group bacterium]